MTANIRPHDEKAPPQPGGGADDWGSETIAIKKK